MNCLSINIQGLGSGVKRGWVKNLCKYNSINVLVDTRNKDESYGFGDGENGVGEF